MIASSNTDKEYALFESGYHFNSEGHSVMLSSLEQVAYSLSRSFPLKSKVVVNRFITWTLNVGRGILDYVVTMPKRTKDGKFPFNYPVTDIPTQIQSAESLQQKFVTGQSLL